MKYYSFLKGLFYCGAPCRLNLILLSINIDLNTVCVLIVFALNYILFKNVMSALFLWLCAEVVNRYVDESADYSVLTGGGSRLPSPNSSGTFSLQTFSLICWFHSIDTLNVFRFKLAIHLSVSAFSHLVAMVASLTFRVRVMLSRQRNPCPDSKSAQ